QARASILSDAAANGDKRIATALFELTPVTQIAINLILSSFTYGAGVENHQIGLFYIRRLHIANLVQQSEHVLCVGLVHLAAKSLNVDAFAGSFRPSVCLQMSHLDCPDLRILASGARPNNQRLLDKGSPRTEMLSAPVRNTSVIRA